jgi:peptidoglycan/xylan/chitin deacetylase (PgdA/CDA1 family)
MLSWNEIHETKRCGITLGPHTLTHPDLTRLRMDQIIAESCDSKKTIGEVLGSSVTSFAYPYGQFNDSIQKLVRQLFASASSDNLGFVNAGSDLYALKRVEAYSLRTDRLFNLTLMRGFPWYIRIRYFPRWVQRPVKSRL